MIQPRAVPARIGLHGEEDRRRATAIDRLRNTGRDSEDGKRKKGCASRRGQRQRRRRHASLKRRVRQAPFAGVVCDMLFEIRTMMRLQPLRAQQYTRE